MSEADLAKLGRDGLTDLALKLAALVEEQAAEIASLRAEVEALQRSGKRRAAPSSKGTRQSAPKEPGRKPGRGVFKTRESPAPEAISEPPIDVPTVEAGCPKCGGELDE